MRNARPSEAGSMSKQGKDAASSISADPLDMALVRASMACNARFFSSSEDEVESVRVIGSLRRTAGLLVRKIDAYGKSINLSLGRTNVLLALNGSPDGRLPLYVLAETLDVTRGNVSNLVQSLIDDGFVATDGDLDDGRRLLARLTPAGKAVLGRYVPRHHAALAALSSGLSSVEKRQLVELLDKLRCSARSATLAPFDRAVAKRRKKVDE